MKCLFLLYFLIHTAIASEVSVYVFSLPLEVVNWDVEKEIDYINNTSSKHIYSEHGCLQLKSSITMEHSDLTNGYQSELVFHISIECDANLVNLELIKGTKPFNNITTATNIGQDIIDWTFTKNSSIYELTFTGDAAILKKLKSVWKKQQNLFPYFKMELKYLFPVTFNLKTSLENMPLRSSLLDQVSCTNPYIEQEYCPSKGAIPVQMRSHCSGLTAYHQYLVKEYAKIDLFNLLPRSPSYKVITQAPCDNNTYSMSLQEAVVNKLITNNLPPSLEISIPLFLPRKIMLKAMQ